MQNNLKTYERPTLTLEGSFIERTGVGGSGPKDVVRHHRTI
jgi:Family of unknown function (DUF5972)